MQKLDYFDKACIVLLILAAVYFGGHCLWWIWRAYGV